MAVPLPVTGSRSREVTLSNQWNRRPQQFLPQNLEESLPGVVVGGGEIQNETANSNKRSFTSSTRGCGIIYITERMCLMCMNSLN